MVFYRSYRLAAYIDSLSIGPITDRVEVYVKCCHPVLSVLYAKSFLKKMAFILVLELLIYTIVELLCLVNVMGI